MELELFNTLLDFISSDPIWTMLFFLMLLGFFVAIFINSTKTGKPYRKNIFFMVWGSISTMTVLGIIAILLIDFFNIVRG